MLQNIDDTWPRRLPLLSCAAAVVALVGCATVPTPAQIEARRQISATIPTCSAAKECEVKWAAARDFVVKTAGWKIQHLQPDYIETYNSVNSSTGLAFRVVKQPQQDGSYQIIAATWCDNWIECIPAPLATLQNFNNYVNASWR